jgi:hypothetical protein
VDTLAVEHHARVSLEALECRGGRALEPTLVAINHVRHNTVHQFKPTCRDLLDLIRRSEVAAAQEGGVCALRQASLDEDGE